MRTAYHWISYLFLIVSVLLSLCIIGFSIFLTIPSIVNPIMDIAQFLIPVSLILGILEIFKKEKGRTSKISLILTGLNLSFIAILLWFGANLV